MAMKATELKGNTRCFKRRMREIELSTSKDPVFENISFQRRVLWNWFLSKSLRNEETKIRRAIDILQNPDRHGPLPLDDVYPYEAVRAILRTDGQFDLRTGDFSAKRAELTVKLASRKSYVKALLDRAFLDMSFDTDETAMWKADQAYQRLMRYLSEEKRTPILPDRRVVSLFGLEVEAFPDLIFTDIRSKTIDVVKVRFRKPNDFRKKSRRKDMGVNNSLELFAYWMVGKSMIPDNDPWTIKGSYYFMGKESDRRGALTEGYFSDVEWCPVFSLEESDVMLKGIGMSKTEELFEPLVEEFRIGEECSGDTCESCDFAQGCHFAHPPLKSEAPRKGKSILDIELTPEQEKAVFARKGIFRVNAGAGAGKTMVVSFRTAFMFEEGISPDKVLLLTFTEAGAREMAERIAMYCEDLEIEVAPEDVRCMTFNSFGNELIKKEYLQLDFLNEPRLIDEIERKKIILDLLDQNHIDGLDYQNILMDLPNAKGGLMVTMAAFDIIKHERLGSYDVNELRSRMTEYRSSIKDVRAYEQLLALFEKYDEVLRDRCLIEFADQERLVFDLLDLDPYYFDSLGYEHIIVDEFQDTSENQLELVKRFMDCTSFTSLMIVGDDSQSIFAFRHADPSVLIDFKEKIEDEVEDIYITENHRSTPEILDFANKINGLNKHRVDKELTATRESGKPVEVKGFYSAAAEYKYIAEVVQEKINEGHAPEEIAVIAYTKSELMKIAGYLSEAGIESAIQAPVQMMENSRILGIISLARAFKSPNSTRDVFNVENCLMGGRILEETDTEIVKIIAQGQERLSAAAKEHEPDRGKRFQEMAEEIALDDDVALKLTESIGRFYTAEDKIDYIEQFVRFGGAAIKREGKYSGVVLSTAHSSKGLEWPVVVNSVTKYDRNGINTLEAEEKRRLFFVSATRARDELYVTGQFKLAGNEKDGYVYNTYIKEAHEVLGKDYSVVDPEALEKKQAKIKAAKERIAKENAKNKSKLEKAASKASIPKKPVKPKKKADKKVSSKEFASA